MKEIVFELKMALDAFVYMQALNSNGGPNNGTLVISQDLLVTAFKKGKFGYASSMGATLAIITLVFAALVFLVFYLLGEKTPRASTTAAAAPAASPTSSVDVRAAVAALRTKTAGTAAVAGAACGCRGRLGRRTDRACPGLGRRCTDGVVLTWT